MSRLFAILAAVLLATSGAARTEASTLEDVRARGTLTCGVMAANMGAESPVGPRGFFADFCHAVAAAVLGNRDAVVFAELEASQWFDAVRRHEVDVLMAPATWTLKRDAALGATFATTYFFGGPGVIAHRYLGYASLSDAHEARVCVQEETTSQDWLANHIATASGSLKAMNFRSGEGRWRAFMQRQCDLMVSDQLFLLVGARQRGGSDNYVIFPDRLALEPQGPVVAADDPVWRSIVAWTVYATLHAERLGLTATNPDHPEGPASGDRDWLLGVTPGIGQPLGLDDRWAARVVQAVGNYGEIFTRNLTEPYGINRGPNALWTDGGLLVPPPLR